MKKNLFVFMFFVPMLLSAAIGPNVSIAPDGTELKWEEGQWDFFIMHKSLVERQTGAHDTGTTNPQADTCIDPNIGSTYTLTSKHIPQDANVDKAFLIWLAPIDPAKISNGSTDNSVTLTFTHATDPSITLTKEITATTQGVLNRNQDITGDFEYEALYFPEDKTTQQQPIGETGIYTYRVEVSDFMKEIIKMGEDKGMNSGEALYGNYNVKGMECSNDESYLTTSGLMGGWFMPFVYTSSHISAKKIFIFHGLTAYRDASQVIKISGFELPDEAVIKLGLVVFEGDPGLSNYLYAQNPEGLQISSETNPNEYAPLYNNCNPPKTQDSIGQAFNYTETFNSISSVFGWESSENYWCVGNPNYPLDTTNPIEYAIDADILMVDASPTGPFYGRFNKGDTSFNIKIGANQDKIYTNMLIVSVDTAMPDVPSAPPDDATDDSEEETNDDNETGNNNDIDNNNDTADTSGNTDPGDADSDTANTDSTDPADSDYSDYNDEYGSDIGPGEYTGECLPDNTCYEDLVCENHTCVYKSSNGCSLLTVD